MEEELDNQIEKILTDARVKINKLVSKHCSQLLKKQAKTLRVDPDSGAGRRSSLQPKRSPPDTRRSSSKHVVHLKDLAPKSKPVRKIYDSEDDEEDDDEDSD
jgi:hypothetical protein